MKLTELQITETKTTEDAWKTRSVQAALRNGYNEIEDFMSGKLKFDQFIDFIDGMSDSQTENSRERQVKENLVTALYHIHRHLKKVGKQTEDELQELEEAIDDLRDS